MANTQIRAKTIIADDQTEVASQIDSLTTAYDVMSTEVISLNVTHFGATKFLITLLFTGPFEYLKSVFVGLKPLRTRLLVMKRTASAKEGLKPARTKIIRMKRTASTKVGLKVAREKLLVMLRAKSPKIGLKVSRERLLVMLRTLTPKIGLLCRAIKDSGKTKNILLGEKISFDYTYTDLSP